MKFMTANQPLFVPYERPQILAGDLDESELAQVANYIVLRPMELPKALSDQFRELWTTGTPTIRIQLGVEIGSDVGPWIFNIGPGWLSVIDGTPTECECAGEPCEHSELSTSWDSTPRLRNWPDEVPTQVTVTELTGSNSEAWLMAVASHA